MSERAEKSRIRPGTTLNLNFQSILSRSRNSSFNFRVVVCRIRLFPIDFKNKMAWVWTTLKYYFQLTRFWAKATSWEIQSHPNPVMLFHSLKLRSILPIQSNQSYQSQLWVQIQFHPKFQVFKGRLKKKENSRLMKNFVKFRNFEISENLLERNFKPL